MHAPINYTSQNLDHLGLVSGLYDELKIGKRLDNLIPQDFEQRDVSIGQAVKAMVINGLGFTQRKYSANPAPFILIYYEYALIISILQHMLNDYLTHTSESVTDLTASSQDVPFATEFILVSRQEVIQLKADRNRYKNLGYQFSVGHFLVKKAGCFKHDCLCEHNNKDKNNPHSDYRLYRR